MHPFYTGKQKILDTGGRVARFEKRFGKNPTGQKPEKAEKATQSNHHPGSEQGRGPRRSPSPNPSAAEPIQCRKRIVSGWR